LLLEKPCATSGLDPGAIGETPMAAIGETPTLEVATLRGTTEEAAVGEREAPVAAAGERPTVEAPPKLLVALTPEKRVAGLPSVADCDSLGAVALALLVTLAAPGEDRTDIGDNADTVEPWRGRATACEGKATLDEVA